MGAWIEVDEIVAVGPPGRYLQRVEELEIFLLIFVVAAVVTVRFEDLQFNVKGMIDQVCRCAGAVPREEGKFTYIVDSGKWGPGE